MDVTAQLRKFVEDVAVGQTKRQTLDGQFINLAHVLYTDVLYDDNPGNDNLLNSKFLMKNKNENNKTHTQAKQNNNHNNSKSTSTECQCSNGHLFLTNHLT